MMVEAPTDSMGNALYHNDRVYLRLSRQRGLYMRPIPGHKDVHYVLVSGEVQEASTASIRRLLTA